MSNGVTPLGESLLGLIEEAMAGNFDREVILFTKETMDRMDDGYLTLYLGSIDVIDKLGMSYRHMDGGVSYIPWSSIIRLHVRGEKEKL